MNSKSISDTLSRLNRQHEIVLLDAKLKDSLVQIERCRRLFAHSQSFSFTQTLSEMKRDSEKLHQRIFDLKGNPHANIKNVQCCIDAFFFKACSTYQFLHQIKERLNGLKSPCKLGASNMRSSHGKPLARGQAKICPKTAENLPEFTSHSIS